MNNNTIHTRGGKWASFRIGSLFDVKRPTARNKDDYEEGDVCFVASGAINNGVLKFAKPHDGEKLDKKNCITVSPVDGSCFYHPYDFLGRGGAGSSVLLLYAKNIKINRYIGLFMSKVISTTTSSKYSYGRMANQKSLKDDFIYLPVDSNNNIDFDYIEKYMKSMEKKILLKYKNYLSSHVQNASCNKKMHECEFTGTWREKTFDELFTIKPGVRLTKDDMIDGLRPFVGATDSNNGITAFCGNTNKSMDSNCLGVNYNGSVVENFYHPYEALFSDDVKHLHLREHEGNKYIYLFFKNIILKQKDKYQYGYKFNGERMQKQTLMVPVNNEGKPDFDYMETYMREIENKILKKYIEIRLANL